MSATPVADPAAPMDHRGVLRALSGLLLVLFMAMLSGTVVGVALPTIVGSLEGSQSQYTWVITASLLTSTASVPIWGKLADLFDKKRLLQIAICIFSLASLACGFAQSTGQLIGFRAVQGLGMGALQVLVQVIIAAMISPKERGRYNGYLGGVMAVATVGGPLLGGAITDASWLGWRWCFFIGIPFTLLAIVVLGRTLHLPHRPNPDTKVDYAGASLIAAGVSLLLLWVTFVDSEFAWLSWQTAAMVTGSLLLLAIAIWVETRVTEPVVPLHVIKLRNTALAIVTSVAAGMAMFGGAVFLGQYFQLARGYSPTEAGLLTIPMVLGVMVASAVAGRMVSRTGTVKPYIVTGSLVLMIGFLVLSTVDHTTAMPLISVGMLAVGTGVGMMQQNLVLLVQNAVPLRDLGAASGAITFFRSLGGTMGVSVLGAVLANQVANKVTEGLTRLGVNPSYDAPAAGGSTLNLDAMPPPVREVVEAAYGESTGVVFLIAAGIAAVGLVASLFLSNVRLRDSIDLPEQQTASPEPAVR